MKTLFSGLVMACLMSAVVATTHAADAEIIRHKLPDSDFPISLAVEVPANKTLVHLSGQVPLQINSEADVRSIAAYGSMEEQTVSTLQAIEKTLKSLNLSMADVYRMQVFLVGQEGKVDFAGFMQGYTRFFGTESQPLLPVRSAVEVAALVNPGWLVEIEVSAARP